MRLTIRRSLSDSGRPASPEESRTPFIRQPRPRYHYYGAWTAVYQAPLWSRSSRGIARPGCLVVSPDQSAVLEVNRPCVVGFGSLLNSEAPLKARGQRHPCVPENSLPVPFPLIALQRRRCTSRHGEQSSKKTCRCAIHWTGPENRLIQGFSVESVYHSKESASTSMDNQRGRAREIGFKTSDKGCYCVVGCDCDKMRLGSFLCSTRLASTGFRRLFPRYCEVSRPSTA